jgi:hypothetical protein
MGKDKVVLDRETYEKLVGLRDSNYDYYKRHYDEYIDKYCKEFDENKKLQNENGYLKALFDKEGDTHVIKYNGKLFRIMSTTHCKTAGVEETLDLTAVPVSEVN